MTQCPVCAGRSIGKVGAGQYYCWNCCLEMRVKGSSVAVYEIDDEGGLLLRSTAPAPSPAAGVPAGAGRAPLELTEEWSCADTGGGF